VQLKKAVKYGKERSAKDESTANVNGQQLTPPFTPSAWQADWHVDVGDGSMTYKESAERRPLPKLFGEKTNQTSKEKSPAWNWHADWKTNLDSGSVEGRIKGSMNSVLRKQIKKKMKQAREQVVKKNKEVVKWYQDMAKARETAMAKLNKSHNATEHVDSKHSNHSKANKSHDAAIQVDSKETDGHRGHGSQSDQLDTTGENSRGEVLSGKQLLDASMSAAQAVQKTSEYIEERASEMADAIAKMESDDAASEHKLVHDKTKKVADVLF